MARPTHVDVNTDDVQAQPLGAILTDYPLESLERLNARAKLLSHDPAGGGLTCIVELDAGRADATRGYHECDKHLFLISGDLTLDGTTLTAPAYWFVPAGVVHGGLATESGAAVLHNFTGHHRLVVDEGEPDGR